MDDENVKDRSFRQSLFIIFTI